MFKTFEYIYPVLFFLKSVKDDFSQLTFLAYESILNVHYFPISLKIMNECRIIDIFVTGVDSSLSLFSLI